MTTPVLLFHVPSPFPLSLHGCISSRLCGCTMHIPALESMPQPQRNPGLWLLIGHHLSGFQTEFKHVSVWYCCQLLLLLLHLKPLIFILIYFGLFIELCFLSIYPVRLCKHESRVIVTKCSIHCSQSLERGLLIAHWTLWHAHFSMRNAFSHKPAFDSVEREIAEWSFTVKVFSTSVVLCV